MVIIMDELIHAGVETLYKKSGGQFAICFKDPEGQLKR